jgi:hypothetical protein
MGKSSRHLVAKWLAEKAALLLEPTEREVVCGDLAETGASDTRALVEILGLVIRRQAACWSEWRPWAALLLVVIPLGLILSLMSRLWADGTSVSVWLYAGHRDWSFLRDPGLRADMVRVTAVTVRQYFLLVFFAWTTGFAIGSWSRRTARVNATVFSMLIFAGTTGSTTVLRNDPRVFSSFVAAVVMPLAVKALLVIVPAVFGMRRALRDQPLSMKAAFIWTVALALLTFNDARAVEMSAGYSGWKPFGPLNDGRLRLLPVVMIWPATLVLLQTAWSRWRQAHQNQHRAR